MALVIQDRVQETCNAPGTGVVTLLGAVNGFQTFAAGIGNSNTTYYTIADQAGPNWEVGLGTLNATATTLTRTTVLSSSNAGNPVNFATGFQNIWCDYPAAKAIYSGIDATFESVEIVSGGGTSSIANGVGGDVFFSNTSTTPANSGYAFEVNDVANFRIDGDVWTVNGTVGQTSGFVRIPSAAGIAGTPTAQVPHTAPLFFNESTGALNIYNPATSTWIPFVSGALKYLGTWNASTNTPTLASGVGVDGNFYITSVAGTTTLDGISSWAVGDWAVFNGTVWQKVSNTNLVVSVNGQTGAVVITLASLGAGSIATQNANAVAITGGSVAGTSISATTIAASGAVNLNPANASVSLQPTGSGSITVKPTLAGTIDNMSIGSGQAASGAFTTLGITNAVSLSGSAGTSGQVLTSQGAGLPPVWTTPSGGGNTFTSSVAWSTGGTSKNAYIDQAAGTINNAGIVISLIASSSQGNLNNITVRLNGTALPNTYPSGGSYPNYTVTVPVADITDATAQTVASVAVSCSGTYGGSFNVANAGTLTNNQPVPFATTLSGSYAPATLPFYTNTSTINYSYTNATNIITRSGVITPTGGTAQNATAASGSFTAQPIAGATISGTATGKGTVGAGNSTVNLSGTIPAVSVYRPAFYAQTLTSTPPVISDPSTSTQTTGAAQGSTVTFPIATASTQYDWLITQRPLSNIQYVTPFGNVQWVPDVTAPTQTIGGEVFNVFGSTGLDTTGAVQLVIS
jgi:hypothetical protein